MGVVSAILKFAGVDWFMSQWYGGRGAMWTGLAMYLLLIAYFVWDSMRAKSK